MANYKTEVLNKKSRECILLLMDGWNGNEEMEEFGNVVKLGPDKCGNAGDKLTEFSSWSNLLQAT